MSVWQTLLVAWFVLSFPAALAFCWFRAQAERKRPLSGNRICNCEPDGLDGWAGKPMRIISADASDVPYRFRHREGQ